MDRRNPTQGTDSAMIMMYAGLRRGELIPPTWGDIDLKNKTISVTKSVEMVNGQSRQKSGGKTEYSVRVIDIPKRLVEYLQPKERAKTELSVFVVSWNDVERIRMAAAMGKLNLALLKY